MIKFGKNTNNNFVIGIKFSDWELRLGFGYYSLFITPPLGFAFEQIFNDEKMLGIYFDLRNCFSLCTVVSDCGCYAINIGPISIQYVTLHKTGDDT